MDKLKIKIKKLYEEAIIPTKGTSGAAAFDLYACETSQILIKAGHTEKIHTGIALEIPNGYVGLIFARSGLATKNGLAPANKVGVIDSDYRGEIMVTFLNHNQNHNQNEHCINRESGDKVINPGERVAQLIIMPVPEVDLVEVSELEDTIRGNGGFGSTGL